MIVSHTHGEFKDSDLQLEEEQLPQITDGGEEGDIKINTNK